jgi:hypothetical protein
VLIVTVPRLPVVSPLFHVSSAMACDNVSFSYEDSGALPCALEAAREALRIWQAALPPGHEDVTDAEERVRDLLQAMDDVDDSHDDDDDDGEQAMR